MKSFLIVLNACLTMSLCRVSAQEYQPRLQVSKSLVGQMGKVNFEVIGQSPSIKYDYQWIVPQTVKMIVEKGKRAVARFAEEGNYRVKVLLKAPGEQEYMELEAAVEVSNTKKQNVISLHKTILESSGWVGTERPEWLIDGVVNPEDWSQKWCAEGRREHEVVIDLGKNYTMYRFRFFDCRTKEDSFENVNYYRIYVSKNTSDWELVVDETGCGENIKDIYISPSIGRYVKFVPYEPDKEFTIRLWEFEVYGAE